MVTDRQVRLLRRKLKQWKTQEAAAAAAGMSDRTARKYQAGPMPSERKKPRTWRTREDPLAGVWQEKIVPLLERDRSCVLQATTLVEMLERESPGSDTGEHLRTLQRRMRLWRALYGPDKEVFFEQVHPPGREAAVDFTNATELGVTIEGELLVHLLFEFELRHSTWTWVDVVFGETFEALVACVQGAVWDLGGVPDVLRSDNLSAATHELKETGGRSLTARFKAVLDHYGMLSTRIRPGESNENGGVEQRHFRTKRAIKEALELRGSRDFDSLDAYRAFVRDVVEQSHNRKVADRLVAERPFFRALPSAPVPNYTTYRPTVRRWSTVRVSGRTYSVPSRLIGHQLEVRQHPDIVEVLFAGHLVETMPRLRGEAEVRIDYRHVIWSLVRKPGAFARYRYREELFPTLTFRRSYDRLVAWRGERADVEYVRILHLAASTMEISVERALAQLLDKGEPFDYAAVKSLVSPHETVVPKVAISPPDLAAYDCLLQGGVA